MQIKKRPYRITFGLIFIVALIIVWFLIPVNKQKEINIGLLTSESSMKVEYDSIVQYINKYPHLKYKEIRVKDITDPTSAFNKFDVIWYQQTDTTEIPGEIDNKELKQALKNYLTKGGNLLLTMEGIKYLKNLELEETNLITEKVEAIDHGFGRKRGLHAYKEHPVFQGLNGGSYIFSPTRDTNARLIGFLNEEIPENGKVIATDWAYITMEENRKLMVEYEFGTGKVIGIGAYTAFHIPNSHKNHLESFMNNVFGYLTGVIKGEKYYWDYSPNRVNKLVLNVKDKIQWKSQRWKDFEWNLKFEHEPTENFWDVAGERMVIMGNEKYGIEEIWAHPFMALKDYEIGFTQNGKKDIKWLSGENKKVKITPNAFERIYKIGKKTLKEIITTDINEPVSIIHYEYSGDESISLFMRYSSNLRFMWPYSSKVTGEIKHTWSDKLNAFVFADKTKDLVTVTGMTKTPFVTKSGQFDELELSSDSVITKNTEEFKGSVFAGLKLENGDAVDIVIAASNEGLKNTISTYKKFVKDPEMVFRQSKKYYQKLLENKLQINTPDTVFNEAYQWALIGTDRFFVNTPGLGKSLVAGYATTASGWNGGHEVNGRPGYAWYFGRDAQWSGFALNGYGDFEKVRSILEIFIKYQDIDGKIFHELTTSGALHYDAADATPLFIVLAGHYLRHSGDEEFIKKNWGSIKQAIDFCFSTDRNNDHLIENTLVGHGWVEGGHLFGGRSTLYLSGCWAAALEEAALLAKIVGETDLQKEYINESETIKQIINTTFWNEDEQFFHHSINNDGSFIEDITVMPAIPLYFNQVNKEKQSLILERFATNNFSSDWGMRIATMENNHFNPHGYHTGSVWPLYTGWTALAEYKNHRPVQGFTHTLNNLMIYKNWSKGFVEEVMNGLEYKPSGVCPHQCWSETMTIQPLVEGMLGYRPNAVENKIEISPALPLHWEKVEFSNIKMDVNVINLKMEKTDSGTSYTFENTGPGKIDIIFKPHFAAGTKIKSITLGGNDKEFSMNQNKDFVQPGIEFKLKKRILVEIEHKKGIGVIPVAYQVEPGDKSKGIRIIKSYLDNGVYIINVEGPANTERQFNIWSKNQIEKVNGATIAEKKSPLYSLKIQFPEDKTGENKFLKKQITIKLKE